MDAPKNGFDPACESGSFRLEYELYEWTDEEIKIVGGNTMKLPNPDRAVVDIEKLRDYCLNPYHPRGRHKARVFASALGLTANEVSDLRNALLAAVITQDAVATDLDGYGQRYVLDFTMNGPAGLRPQQLDRSPLRRFSTADKLLCPLMVK